MIPLTLHTVHNDLLRQAEILACLPDGVTIITTDGVIRYTNPAFDALFGCAAGELIGQPAAVLHAAGAPLPQALAAEIADTMAGKGKWQGEILSRRKDGSEFWARACYSALQISDQGPGWICTWHDITAAREDQALLKASEERYRALVGETSVVTWHCPANGLHDEPDASWMAFTGQSAEAMLGDGWMKAIHPDDVATSAETWNAAVRSGLPYFREHRVRRHDGAWCWMSVRAAPVRNAQGHITEWVGMGRDVTERKLAELALQDSEERLSLALSGSGLAFWDWNIVTREVFADQRWFAMLGYSPGSLSSQEDEWFGLIHPDDLENVRRSLQACLSGDTELYQCEYRLRHKTGHWAYLEASGKVSHRDRNGKPLRMVGTVLDVSQRRRLNDQGVALLKQIEGLIRDATAGRASAPEADPALANQLTRRQRQTIALIARGLTSAEIAGELRISTATAIGHRRELMKRLGLHSTADLTRFAVRHKLITD